MEEYNEDEPEFTPDPEAMLDEAIEESCHWIKEVTYRELSHPSDLQKSLANGMLLCELVLAIKRESVNRPNKYTPKKNVTEFLKACKEKLGLEPSQLFAPDDLESTSRRLSWSPASAPPKSDREKLKSIVTTVYWIAEATENIPSYTGPKLDTYAFESVIFGIYTPRETPKSTANSTDQQNKSQEVNEDPSDSVFEENILNLPETIVYKEPRWKADLKALQTTDPEGPIKPVRGQLVESIQANFGRANGVDNHASVASTESRAGNPDETGSGVVLRQPSAVRLRRMERKLGAGRKGPPTSAKPHTRSLSLPESSNVTMLRQNALDSNHNSATYEDLDDDDEDQDMWRSSFNSWKMKRNQVASNVLERKAFREEVEVAEQNKGKKKPKTFREIVEEKQRREKLLAKKLERRKDLEKDEIHAILTSVDLVDSSESEEEKEPEVQVEVQEEQHTRLEPVTESQPRSNTLPTREKRAFSSSSSSSSSSLPPHKPAPITVTSTTTTSHKPPPSVAPKPKYRPSAGAFQPYRRSQSLNEGVDLPENGDAADSRRGESSSPSTTAATTPSEESFPARSFHEKILRDREKEKQMREEVKVGQETARRPTQKRMSLGIMGRIAAFNSGEAFKKKGEGSDEESEQPPSRTSVSRPPKQQAPQEPAAFTELTISMSRRPRSEGGFGFTVTGGVDKKKPIVVKDIEPGSAAKFSKLMVGDEIIAINGERTKMFDHDDFQYSISQAVLSGNLDLKVRRYDANVAGDGSHSQPRTVSASSSSYTDHAQARLSARRAEEEEERRREEERQREMERRRKEEEERRKEEERRREEERKLREEEERRREEERRQREEEEERRRREEEEIQMARRREERLKREDGSTNSSPSGNALSRAKQLLDELGDDETSSEETPRQNRGALDDGYTNGDLNGMAPNSWNGSSQRDEETREDEEEEFTEEERLEEAIMDRLQREEKEEDQREEVHRLIEKDEQDKSPIKESIVAPTVQTTEESAPPPSSFSSSLKMKPTGFRSVKGPKPFIPANKGPQPFRPQAVPSVVSHGTDIKEKVKKDRSDFFPDEQEESTPEEQNMEDLWKRVEQPNVETVPAPENEVQLRSKPVSSRDNANRKSFNVDEERQRLEKWQREQERLRQEQYEQEQRRLQEEQEKDLQRAEIMARRKQEEELKALQVRKRMLQKKAQEELKKREEEMLEKERQERERRRIQQMEQEEKERIRREEEERLRLEQEEEERREQEERERKEAEWRREEELMLVKRRKEEEKRREEQEKRRIQEEREARERKAREKIQKEKEEYEKLLKEREEEMQRIAREKEERQRAAREKDERERQAREQEEKERLARQRQERERIEREREKRQRLLQEQTERQEKASSQRPVASEIIQPQMQQRQESAPPLGGPHRRQPSQDDMYKRIREEERERIRQEERERLRREWEQLEQEKLQQQERHRQEEEQIERLRREQAELQREREQLEQQQKEEKERLARQRKSFLKSSSDEVFQDDNLDKMNSINRKNKQLSEEDPPLKAAHLQAPGKDIIDRRMVPERDSKPGQVYMSMHRDDNLPVEKHWLVEEAKRRHHDYISKSTDSLVIQPRKDSLDHEPVLERKLYGDENAAPTPNIYHTKPYETDYRKPEPPGFEQEIPTRIPPPHRDQGSLPRPAKHPHESQQSPTSADTNRWDAPRHKYETQPEFRQVQRRMHGQPDPERKQKMHHRRSMPDLSDKRSFMAPTARIMDDPSTLRGSAVGGPPRGGLIQPQLQQQQRAGPPGVRGGPPHHMGPAGDQKRGGPAPGPDSLIQPHDHRRGPKSPPVQVRGSGGPPPQSRAPPRQQQQPLHSQAPGRGQPGPRSSAFQQPNKNPPPGRSVSGKVQCSNCGKSLGRGAAMIIESLGLHFHLECFRCCVCNIQLGNGTKGTDVRIRANKLHCQNCYSNDAGFEFTEV